jgi:hypothetical protein
MNLTKLGGFTLIKEEKWLAILVRKDLYGCLWQQYWLRMVIDWEAMHGNDMNFKDIEIVL